MTSTRKLDDIVSNLEDMSETIEDIKDRVGHEPIATEKLDVLQTDMTRTADLIEETLEMTHPVERPETTPSETKDS